LGEHYEPVRDRGRQQFVSLDDRAVVDIAVAAARLLPQGGLVTIAEALLADQRLSFVVEFAKVYAEEKGSALPEDVSDRLLDALRKHFQKLGEQPVRNMSQGDRRLLYRWQRLAGNAAPVREQLWRNVQDGWSLPQLLGALVPEATTWLGGNGNRQVIDEADPAQWDDLLDLRRVIAELGDLVDQAEEHIPDVDELEPTPQLRERYALSVVKRFKQQPTDA
jgi:hypothetical protein